MSKNNSPMANMVVGFLTLLFFCFVYVVIGAVIHNAFHGDTLAFNSAATWAYLFGWPFVLLLWLLKIAVVVFVALFLLWLAGATL